MELQFNLICAIQARSSAVRRVFVRISEGTSGTGPARRARKGLVRARLVRTFTDYQIERDYSLRNSMVFRLSTNLKFPTKGYMFQIDELSSKRCFNSTLYLMD